MFENFVVTQELRDVLTVALTVIAAMLILGVLVVGTSATIKGE